MVIHDCMCIHTCNCACKWTALKQKSVQVHNHGKPAILRPGILCQALTGVVCLHEPEDFSRFQFIFWCVCDLQRKMYNYMGKIEYYTRNTKLASKIESRLKFRIKNRIAMSSTARPYVFKVFHLKWTVFFEGQNVCTREQQPPCVFCRLFYTQSSIYRHICT